MSATLERNPVRVSEEIVRELFEGGEPRSFGVRLWDGTELPPEAAGPPRFTLVLRHPGALRNMLRPPLHVSLGEAYVDGDFDVEGDLGAVFAAADHIHLHGAGLLERLRLAQRLHSLPAEPPPAHARAARLSGVRHSLSRDRQAISYHYDQPLGFWKLWLDEKLVYSCAYFQRPDVSLDTAQTDKLDLICRKLYLRPGERFFDLGCGWGALVIHAARNYGVQALGVTLSEPQARYAEERIQSEGLADRCRVELRDYREVEGEFDKIASVGAVEHMGAAQLPGYFARVWSLLRPGGLFMNHGIARSVLHPVPNGPTFSDRYIFPDGELVPLHVMLRAAERAAFEVRDVEDLREHYALTLDHWRSRLESRRAEVERVTDPVIFRLFRVYLAACAHDFRVGVNQIYQTLLVRAKDGNARLPLTRAGWYAARPSEEESAETPRELR